MYALLLNKEYIDIDTYLMNLTPLNFSSFKVTRNQNFIFTRMVCGPREDAEPKLTSLIGR